MKKISIFISAFIILIVLSSMTSIGDRFISIVTSTDNNETEILKLPTTPFNYEIQIPSFIENSEYPNTLDKITNEGATLGRVLFYDKKLSSDNSTSCGSCHKQEFNFADNTTHSEGISNHKTSRNTLQLTDIAWQKTDGLFWDRRHIDLKKGVVDPLINPKEIGADIDELIKELKSAEYYTNLFKAAFGNTEITEEKISEALAQFIRSITSFESKLDKGIENNFVAFTKSELRGLELFGDNCGDCHPGSMGSNNYFRSPPNNKSHKHLRNKKQKNQMDIRGFRSGFTNGLDSIPNDLGKGKLTNNEKDFGVFKAPNLRNIEASAPYMHDGRFATLEEVIDFYSEGLQSHPNSFYTQKENDRKGLFLTDQEKSDLLAFLKTQKDDNYLTNEKWSDPFITVETGD